MDFNDRDFGTITKSLVKSPYVIGSDTGLPVPPPGDFYLSDDSDSFLLDDSGDNLVTP